MPVSSSAGASAPKLEMKALTEADCGISGFVNSASGFYGLLKQRYSDFQVHEVDLDGNQVRLTQLLGQEAQAAGAGELKSSGRPPTEPSGQAEALAAGQNDTGKATEASLLEERTEEEEQETDAVAMKSRLEAAMEDDEAKRSLEELHGEEVRTSFFEFLGRSLAGEDAVFWFPESADKELRRKTHSFVKQRLGDDFVSETKEFDQDGEEVKQTHRKNRERRICVRRTKKRARRGRQQRDDGSRRQAGGKAPDFLSFVLYKENAETMACIHELSKKARVYNNSFSWAGTKDKRGITSQRCTVRGRMAQDFARFSRPSKGRELRAWGGWRVPGGRFVLGNFEAVTEALRLGDLYGNHFDIVLRHVRLKQDEETEQGEDGGRPTRAYLDAQCAELQKSGFINFFGMQRFGMGPVGRGTADVGRLLLQRRWEDAVRAVLGQATGDREEIAAAKDLFLKGGDAKSAYQAMPRYMNAERIVLKMLGQCENGYLNALLKLPRQSVMMYLHAYQSRLWNRMAHERIVRFGTEVLAGDLIFEKSENREDGLSRKRHRGAARVVTEAEASSGAFSIKDVVLPMVGFDVILPENEIGLLLRGALEEDGLSLGDLRNDSQPSLSVGGDYRRVMCFLEEFKYEVVTYEAPEAPLLESDLEILGRGAGGEEEPAAEQRRRREVPMPMAEKDSQEIGLRLSFTLPASAYATMAIRELTKESSERGGSNYGVVKRSAQVMGDAPPNDAQQESLVDEPDEGPIAPAKKRVRLS